MLRNAGSFRLHGQHEALGLHAGKENKAHASPRSLAGSGTIASARGGIGRNTLRARAGCVAGYGRAGAKAETEARARRRAHATAHAPQAKNAQALKKRRT